MKKNHLIDLAQALIKDKDFIKSTQTLKEPYLCDALEFYLLDYFRTSHISIPINTPHELSIHLNLLFAAIVKTLISFTYHSIGEKP